MQKKWVFVALIAVIIVIAVAISKFSDINNQNGPAGSDDSIPSPLNLPIPPPPVSSLSPEERLDHDILNTWKEFTNERVGYSL